MDVSQTTKPDTQKTFDNIVWALDFVDGGQLEHGHGLKPKQWDSTTLFLAGVAILWFVLISFKLVWNNLGALNGKLIVTQEECHVCESRNNTVIGSYRSLAFISFAAILWE
ncbi:hypothetical protein E2542_SST19169 [Spatholobus suberectus]|nr:hypothetical protein E2542_SST19169 [Spatholobus suberectus]